MKNENGIEKSATLKGRTLVNLVETYNVQVTSISSKAVKYTYGSLDTSKSYLLKYRVNQLPELTDTDANTRAFKLEWYHGSISKGHLNVYNKDFVVGKNNTYIIKPYIDDVVRTSFGIFCPNYVSGTLDMDVMIIEYQQGMENWDIPYFEGMQSVAAPILTTSGKNLCKYRDNWTHGGLTFTNTENGVIVNGTATVYVDYYVSTRTGLINVETLDLLNSLPVGTQLILSNNLGKNNYIVYTENGGENKYKPNVTIQNNMEFRGVFVRFQEADVCDNLNLTIQLEVGSTATSYEPYQSNILSTNEDVVLRGIGDVKDELDCLNGQVTERIGEVVLDGSENWTYEASYTNDNVYGCLILLNQFSQKPKPSNFNFANNLFPNITNNSYSEEGFAANT